MKETGVGDDINKFSSWVVPDPVVDYFQYPFINVWGIRCHISRSSVHEMLVAYK